MTINKIHQERIRKEGLFLEHYDGEFYTLRLFSPIEGEIYSLNSTEEGTHLTAYEMENYS